MQASKLREQDREEFDLLGPPHPGEIVRDELLPRLRLSRKALARQLNISYSTALRMLNGRRRVTSELAVSLARLSGTQVVFWLVMQAHYDAWQVQQRQERAAPPRRSVSSPKMTMRKLPETTRVCFTTGRQVSPAQAA